MFAPDTRVLMFAMTSGTTGEPKRLPITDELFREYRAGWRLRAAGVYGDHRELVRTKTLQLTSDWQRYRAPCGTACGQISGLAASTRPKIASRMLDLPVRVYCDGMLIEQVVVNLLSNAVKYSGDTPVVEIKIWMDGSRAFCSVRDWGIGIPADELPKIFDRFYRARTASGIAGTGIGLNFAQRIMHLHGGEIQVESYEAAGSLFTFDLPIANADQTQQAA